MLTEEGIAYLYKAQSLEQRKAMIAAVAGVTPIGLRHDPGRPQRCAARAWSRCPKTSACDRSRGDPLAAGGQEHGRSRRLVGRPVRPAGTLQELVMRDDLSQSTARAAQPQARRTSPSVWRSMAVAALIDEATLSPKPGSSTSAAAARITTSTGR